MNYKLLQLNIYKGKYIDNLIKYLNENDFDIICLQEVAGGSQSFNDDNYQRLIKNTNYDGQTGVAWTIQPDSSNYMGNSIFYKKVLNPQNPRNFFMKPFKVLSSTEENWESRPRCAFFLDFELNEKTITVGSTHLAWGPTPSDTDYKVEQGKKLLNYVKSIETPVVLCGDFNLPPESLVIKSFSQNFENQTTKKGLTNTLNLENHAIKEDVPEGLAVDYIFTSKDVNVVNFELIDTPELSDHLGLSLTFQA
jgi:endonuclease/exonuclease/phosphatase family metal-dependent hydrolase